METGKASKTALRVAIRRAAHQLMEHPRVLDDPIAVPLLGPGFARDMERAMHKVARDFRAFMAARSRYVEDKLACAVAKGVTQYVVLGAGLDTFSYRNPFAELRVFEVDFPATQEWKRAMLRKAGIEAPESLTFVPLDFERKTLAEGLEEAGFYPDTLSPKRRMVFDALSERVAAAGEPFRLFFTPEEMESELRTAGFQRIEQVDSKQLNEIYFKDRADGLKLSDSRSGMLATAWV
jgi:O-methyltransferase involved in polyketide biosynthesis